MYIYIKKKEIFINYQMLKRDSLIFGIHRHIYHFIVIIRHTIYLIHVLKDGGISRGDDKRQHW